MAGARAIEQAYSWMGPLYNVIPGGDITAGKFDESYQRSLAEAQNVKHNFVLDNLGIKQGSLFFDIGCGAGPLVQAATLRGAEAAGITLDRNQAQAARKKGLNILYGNYFDLKTLPEGAGTYDAVSCVEAMEHFCGVQEYRGGKQEDIYQDFFRRTSALLKDGGKMFLQTVTFGSNAPKTLDEISMDAPKGSNQQVTAGLLNLFPDSISPESLEQVVACASPYFDVVTSDNGVRDYIETLDRWGDLRRLSASTILPKLKLGASMVGNSDLRKRVLSLKQGYMKQAFRRGIIDHWRVVLQKKSEVFSPENAKYISLRISDMLNALGVDSGFQSTPDALDVVYLGKDTDESSQIDNALAFVHKPTAKVLLLDSNNQLIDQNPNLSYLTTWGKGGNKRETRRFTEATSLQLNSIDFWKTWSQQFNQTQK